MARFKTGHMFIQYTFTERANYRIIYNKIQRYIKIVLADEEKKNT